MKLRNFLVLILLFVIAIACSEDSSTEPETVATDQIESELKELDQMIFKMAGSDVNGVMDAMPDGLIDLYGLFSFQKNVVSGAVKSDVSSLQKTAADTSIVDLIGDLLQLFGTHTWDGTQWDYSDSPADQIVIIFPYENQTVTVKFLNLSVSNTSITMSVEVLIDDVKRFSLNVDLKGSGFFGFSGNPSISSISVSGSITDNVGVEYSYSVEVSDSKIDAMIGETGEKQLKVTVDGSGFLGAAQNGPDAVVTKVTVEYGAITMIIDDPDAEQGDIGDVLYNGVKVADLIIKEDGQLYIIYINGGEKLFSQVMLSFGLIAQ